jgi:hypothetical protein
MCYLVLIVIETNYTRTQIRNPPFRMGFIYCLFNDATSSSDYIASNDRAIDEKLI